MSEWIAAAVDGIVDDLTDRKGLRHEWDNIDEEIAEEIKAQWRQIIAKACGEKP